MILSTTMDYKISVSTNSYEVLQSGTVIVPPGEHVHFEIEGLQFRFTFSERKSSDNSKNTGITGSLIQLDDKNCLVIDVINYEELFATPKDIIEVGTLKGKKLYVRFSVVTLGKDDESDRSRIFYYTWYLAK